MKNLFFVTLTLFASLAFGQSKQTELIGANSLSVRANLIKNPSAFSNDQFKTTSSATATRDTDAADRINHKASWLIDASAQNGYVEFELDTPSSELTSGNCMYYGEFKGDGSLYRAQILDGSAVMLNQSQALNSQGSTGWVPFFVTYPCGASGARKVRITQTESGTAPAINVGLQEYTRATNITSGASPNVYTVRVDSAGTSSGWTNSTSWIGNGQITDTSLYTFTLSGFTSAPNCQVDVVDSSTDGAWQAKLNAQATATSLVVRSGVTDASSNFIKSARPFNITCTRTGADYIQTAIRPGNYDFGATSYTPTVSNLGTGSGTVSATYARKGSNTEICINFLKDGSSGSGASIVSFTYPTGVVGDTARFPGGSTVMGTGWTSLNNNNIALGSTGTSLVFYNGNDLVYGSTLTSGSTIRGCVTFPVVGWVETQGADQLIQSVVALDNSTGVTTINTVVTKTANYTATVQDETILMNTTSGNWTLSLPAAATAKGKKYVVQNIAGSGRAIIDPNGSETICGRSTISVIASAVSPNDEVTIQSDGTNWVGLNNSCRLTFSGTLSPSCTTNGACTIASQWPNATSSATRASTGNITLGWTTGVMGTASGGSCTCSSVGASDASCSVYSLTTSDAVLRAYTPAGTAQDGIHTYQCTVSR